MENVRINRVGIKIEKLKNELIKTLQDYSRSQVELWRQVPALAREADRLKNRTSGRYQTAYLIGYWPLFSRDMHRLWVELNTGEFGRVQLFGEIKLGEIDSIMEALDANGVINLLKNEIQSLSAIS